MNRISRGLKILQDGALLQYLKWKWREHVKHKQDMWWQSQAKIRENIEIVIQSGIKMRLYFDSKLSQILYFYPEFESQELRFLNTFLKPGDIFVDVGANIGLYTLIAASLVGLGGVVYAFEPCSKTFQRLVNNVHLNNLNNVFCHQIALSDKTSNVDMVVSLDGFDAWNSFAQPVMGKSFASETVTSITWDGFIQEHKIAERVTLMKIDVEGWETKVLAGGREFFSRTDAPALQVEFTEQACQSAGSSCEELYHQLEELGYQMFIYDAKSRRLIPDPLRENYPYLNLIATKQPKELFARIEEKILHSQ